MTFFGFGLVCLAGVLAQQTTASSDIRVPQALFVALVVVFLTAFLGFLGWMVKTLIQLGKLTEKISVRLAKTEEEVKDHAALITTIIGGAAISIHKPATPMVGAHEVGEE